MTELVTLTIEDAVARLTLARPEAGNAMSWDLIDQLARATETIAADRRVRAVLLSAQGRNFCVGGDIQAFAAEADPSGFIRRLAERLHESVARLAALPVPVVIAVQGAAAGAGFSLAALGDIVLASENASFTLAYTGIGLTSDGGATWSLPRLIGMRRTQELAYTNRRLSAAEAHAMNIVTRVVPDDQLAAEAEAMARRLATGPTAAYAGVKRLLAEGQTRGLAQHLDAEAVAISIALGTQDAQGAVKAFLAREKPRFEGR